MMNDADKLNIHHDLLSCQKVYNAESARMELHTHASVEIGLVVAGSGVHLVLDQAIPCQVGDIFVTPSNIPHRYFVDGEGDCLKVRRLRFSFDECTYANDVDPEDLRTCYGIFGDGAISAYAMLNRSMTERVCELLDAIEREITDHKKRWREAVLANLSLLLINIERYIDSSIKNKSSFTPKEWNIVLSAIQIMKNNLGDASLTQGSIAETLGVSSARLSRVFKELSGECFADHMRTLRLDLACRLLRESEMTVEEIVAKCGLRDIPSFYKNFNVYVGKTPSEYRRSVTRGDRIRNNKKSKEEKIMILFSEISENVQKG